MPERLNPPEHAGRLGGLELESLGQSMGTGVICHSFEPRKEWRLTFHLDTSVRVTDGLFNQFVVLANSDKLDHHSAIAEGASLLREALAEVGLELLGEE